MACQKLTEEQLKKHLDEILRMKNDNETMIEKNIALLEWKCRYRQKAYFDAGDMESVADEELRLIKELKTLTVEIPGDNFLPRARARMKAFLYMVSASYAAGSGRSCGRLRSTSSRITAS